MNTIKTIDLHTIGGHTVQLKAIDEGEWHDQTATSEAWGFLTIKLQSRFWSKRFRHRMLGKHALDLICQIDNRAPELPDDAGGILDFVNACIKGYRDSGIALSKV